MRKIFILIIGILVVATAALLARELEERNQQQAEERLLQEDPVIAEQPQDTRPQVAQFSDFAVSNLNTYAGGPPAEVFIDLDSELAQFEEIITEQASSGPNFAGEYTVITWDCVNENSEAIPLCQQSIIVHAETGVIHAKNIASHYDLSYSIDSTLLIVNDPNVVHQPELLPSELSQSFAIDYYLFEDNKLGFLYKRDSEGEIIAGCPEIVIAAKNMVNGEIAEFSSRCDVPSGWGEIERVFIVEETDETESVEETPEETEQ